ncbi:MAG TPA: hypothetical protein VKA89_11785 [Solirubrobacterales bacterium]|nr:hypothetical protein [Solirubrobacterales bacterium]
MSVPSDRAPATSGLGRLPMAAAAAAGGLLVCTVAQALSRATLDPPISLYWLGLLVIVVPVFLRLTSEDASDRERLALVLLLGLALYSVKVVRDSFAFGFSDEPVHAFNALQIAEHGRLFAENSLLPVTPFYPGLEGATAALMSMSGLSAFGAGLIVVGAARLLMVAALFVLFRRLTGSARAAGLAVAVYVGSFNFLYFSAQYSYESMSLPLFAAVLACLAERGAGMRAGARDWTVPLTMLIGAVVVTHHLSSYALVITLVALAVVSRLVKRRAPNPWPFAVLALAMTLTWLLVVASTTVGYLTPVLDNAFNQALDTVQGSKGPRSLFEAEDTAAAREETPLLAQAVALGAIALLFAGLVLGMRNGWERLRRDPFGILFAVAGFAFFASLTLRFVPAAWETGNRASGFLFIGLALVVVYALLDRHLDGLRRLPARLAVSAALGVVFVGGAISGWPWDVHLSLPSRAEAEGNVIESEPAGLGEWAANHLPSAHLGSSASAARLVLERGGVYVIAGKSPNVAGVLEADELARWQFRVLDEADVSYVVADRRERSEDGIRGYAFSVRRAAGTPDDLRDLSSTLKFEEVPSATRIFDSGLLAVYDMDGLP